MNKKSAWFVIVPILLFSALAICVKEGMTAGIEGRIYTVSVMFMSPLLTCVMKGITHTGNSAVVIPFCLLLIAIPKSRKTLALPVSAAVVLSAVLNTLLKNIFARQRPDIFRLINETDYSFPSGHAMINASLYVMLVLLMFKFIKNTPLKLSLSIFCIALTIAIGYSRIYLGVHYAGDVLGGWLMGFAVSVFVYSVWNKKVGAKKKNPFD